MQIGKFNIIVAVSKKDNGIGFKNSIPWNNSVDLKYFRNTTLNHVIIMGRLTFESLNYKPLKDRINIVISNTLKQEDYGNILIYKTLNDALNYCFIKKFKEIFVIGGEKIYQEALTRKDINKIYLTEINDNNNIICDKFFPKIPTYFKCVSTDVLKESSVIFKIYENKLHPFSNETQYTDLIYHILHDGEKRLTRNGYVLSIFGISHKFNIEHSFPLLTTKKMFFRGIVEELLFFIRGDTQTKKLEEKGISIWKSNTTKEFLKSKNLQYEEGEMGPMYGYQWRNFNSNQYDQLYKLIESLIRDPYSRRHLMTTYNPLQLELGVLPPCHSIVLQFYVRQDKYLDCFMYQRSADVGLGYPFNIASTSLLVYLIASITSYHPGMLNISLGDAHIYEEHISALTEQFQRIPLKQCRLKILKKYSKENEFDDIKDRINWLENLNFRDFELENYISYSNLKMEMKA